MTLTDWLDEHIVFVIIAIVSLAFVVSILFVVFIGDGVEPPCDEYGTHCYDRHCMIMYTGKTTVTNCFRATVPCSGPHQHAEPMCIRRLGQ